MQRVKIGAKRRRETQQARYNPAASKRAAEKRAKEIRARRKFAGAMDAGLCAKAGERALKRTEKTHAE
jgi:hypothetical protein